MDTKHPLNLPADLKPAVLKRLIFPTLSTLSLLLCACSGGGSTSGAGGVLPATHAAGTLHLAFTVPTKLLSRLKQSTMRFPQYVAPTTTSLIVTLAANGGPASAPQTFPCTATCSASLPAPAGSDVVSLELADGTHALSLVTTTVTIQSNVTNAITLTANPVVDHVAFALGAATVNSGATSTIPITLNAYDADNNLIVGPGTFVDGNNIPVTLGLTATTSGAGGGIVTLSQTSLTAPATAPITATYANGWANMVTIAPVVPPAVAAHTMTPLTASVPVLLANTEFYTGISGGAHLTGISAGPDGNLYALESATNIVDRITAAGVVTQIPIPIPGATTLRGPWDITTGPDGNLWFTMNHNLAGGSDGAVVKMTPAGAFTFYTGGSIPNGQPFDITAGADGNMWFAEAGANLIGRITPAGVLTEFHAGMTSFNPNGVTAGPDGNIWFTEAGDNADDGTGYIGKITPSGVITDYALPAGTYSPHYIATGPDHNLWFSEHVHNGVGRITPSGIITQFLEPSLTGAALTGSTRRIVAGQDGRMWLVMDKYTGFTAVDMNGVVSYYPSGTTSMAGDGGALCVGPDGNLWTTQQDSGIIRFAFN